MVELTQGANAPLAGASVIVAVDWPASVSVEADVSAYLLTDAGRVRGDADMMFFNNPVGGEGAVRFSAGGGPRGRFEIDLANVPPAITRIVFCVTIDEAAPGKATLAALTGARITAGDHSYAPALGNATEAAMILGEVYLRGGQWKFRAVGQGFDGGLAPLARSFGIDVAEEASAPKPGPSLEKRLIDLEKRDPQLVSLVKKVQVSLAKHSLPVDRAKVALCLDISGSMHGLYKSGKIDQLVQRIMALGFRFDDDGRIDVFLFGTAAHGFGELGVEDYGSFTADMLARHRLEPGTYYGLVMERIRAHYAGQPDFGTVPVYVMFVTDGGTGDARRSETQIKAASAEPIFWQFMAIGAARAGSKSTRKRLPSGFEFLEHLDAMPGRVIDNANFFCVADPAELADEELYDLLMSEYPAWLKAAIAQRIVTPGGRA